MIEQEQFDSDSDVSLLDSNQPHPVSILKHLPAPLKLLEQHNPTYELYSPRCLYTQQLARTNKYLMPKPEEATKVVGHRLQSIEDAVFEHCKIKEKIKEIYSKNQRQSHHTLWELYKDKEPYYSRFETLPKKQHFASIFMNVAGVNLEGKLKGSFPQIRPKTNAQSIKNNNGSVIFDSHFESGNLLFVYKNEDERNSIDTYDLILQNDINTKGHNQWFYFKITNTKKNQKIKLNIINLVKKESLFSYGLKPLVFSQKANKTGHNWHRGGFKICYQESNIKRQHNNQSYYTLSFQYEFREALDTVYFAPSYPYTYTQLLYYMDSLLTNKIYSNFLSIKLLSQTVGKNVVNLISISSGKQAVKDSKIIWIIARQHPVETTSSYMVEGIINYLLNIMSKATTQGDTFYQNYIFKIVPMVNPDGVIHGNTRAELTGIDSNRAWKKTHKTITPVTHYLKKQILKTKQETCMILDLHSHSKKLGCFFYGNYESSDIKSYRMWPSRVCENDVRFCYRNCRFRGGNDNSARKAIYSELKIPNIFTVQCSLLGYVKDNRITEYKIQDYLQMGEKIIQTFFELEKEKYDRLVPISNSYPNQQADFCDAQSARSDSCVSQDEYQEVYNFAKPKKKVREVKKSKPKSNTFIYQLKHNTSQTHLPKKPQATGNNPPGQPKQDITITSSHQNSILDKNLKTKSPFKEENRFKMRSKYNSKNIRFLPKKICQSIKEQVILKDANKNRTVSEQSIQVQQLKGSNSDVKAPQKNQRGLMVVGSGVEEDKIYVGKNEVGIQMDMDCTKQNLGYPSDSLYSSKLNASSKYCTKGRKIDDLKDISIVRLDRSMKMQRRGVLMFRN